MPPIEGFIQHVHHYLVPVLVLIMAATGQSKAQDGSLIIAVALPPTVSM